MQQVKEFPDEGLMVSGSRPFCNTGKEEIGSKATIIHLYVKSERYVYTWQGTSEAKKIHDTDIAEAFKAIHNDQEYLAGENLSSECQVYRINVIIQPF